MPTALLLARGARVQLPRRIGRARALGMALLGKPLKADEAERIGLIWRAVPDEQASACNRGADAARPFYASPGRKCGSPGAYSFATFGSTG
jgi:enoyl-CoA hydratase/carnithine racemase